jgi:hypothetical protein
MDGVAWLRGDAPVLGFSLHGKRAGLTVMDVAWLRE